MTLMAAAVILMLRPALSGARDDAMRAGCLDNMRKSGSAFQLYANDYEGFAPFMIWGDWPGSRTVMRGLDFVGYTGYIARDSDATLCPAWPPYKYNSRSERYAVMDPGGRAARIDGWFSHTHMVAGVESRSQLVKLTDLKKPGDFILLSEATRKTTGTQADYWHPHQEGQNLHFRHGGISNVAFGDGSAESCSEERYWEAIREGTYNRYDNAHANLDFYYLPYGWEQGDAASMVRF